MITIPADTDFGGADFLDAPAIAKLATRLIERDPLFVHLSPDGPTDDMEPIRVRYLWRRKGSVSGGMEVLGKTSKASGVTKHFGVCDFVVVIAADFVRQREMDDQALTALVWHELRHIAFDPETDKPGIVGHDYELFRDELARWGDWKAGLGDLIEEVRQLELPFREGVGAAR